MSGVSLDKEGEVVCPVSGPNNNVLMHWRWSDLSPFEQGYVEALFAGGVEAASAVGLLTLIARNKEAEKISSRVSFSDLARETLAAIRKDCADLQKALLVSDDLNLRDCGRIFWEQRQAGTLTRFPPLTPTLSEDGKVRLALAKGAVPVHPPIDLEETDALLEQLK